MLESKINVIQSYRCILLSVYLCQIYIENGIQLVNGYGCIISTVCVHIYMQDIAKYWQCTQKKTKIYDKGHVKRSLTACWNGMTDQLVLLQSLICLCRQHVNSGESSSEKMKTDQVEQMQTDVRICCTCMDEGSFSHDAYHMYRASELTGL